MTKIIEAQMEGVCGICKKRYEKGTRILKDTQTGKWCEANCKWPDKVNANSRRIPTTSVARQLGRSAIGIEISEEYTKLIKQRLNWGFDPNIEWKVD